MNRAGLTEAAGGFALSPDEIAGLVRAAPSMRPERHTVLSATALTDSALAEAVADVVTHPSP
jgi:hypothetical protein